MPAATTIEITCIISVVRPVPTTPRNPSNTGIASDACPPPSAGFIVREPAQVRALASPVRQEIVDALVAAGACSISDLAQHLGRAPDALYFHVRRLVKVGLVIERERRKDGRHAWAVYDLPGRPVRLSYQPPNKPRDLTRVIASAIRLSSRDFARAMSDSGYLDPDVPPSGPRRVWGGRAKGWLTDDQLSRVNALIEEAMAIVRDSGPPAASRGGRRTHGASRLVSVGVLIAPVTTSARAPSPRARATPKGASS